MSLEGLAHNKSPTDLLLGSSIANAQSKLQIPFSFEVLYSNYICLLFVVLLKVANMTPAKAFEIFHPQRAQHFLGIYFERKVLIGKTAGVLSKSIGYFATKTLELASRSWRFLYSIPLLKQWKIRNMKSPTCLF